MTKFNLYNIFAVCGGTIVCDVGETCDSGACTGKSPAQNFFSCTPDGEIRHFTLSSYITHVTCISHKRDHRDSKY